VTVNVEGNVVTFTLDDPDEIRSLQWIEKHYGANHLIIQFRDVLARKTEERRLDAIEQVKTLLFDDDVIALLKSKGVDL
jgi:hypothetical protein